MKQMIRADHIGSLMRPKVLRDAYKSLAAGKLSAIQFDAVLDDSIRDAVRMQEAAGIGAITDGEFRRRSDKYNSHSRCCRNRGNSRDNRGHNAKVHRAFAIWNHGAHNTGDVGFT